MSAAVTDTDPQELGVPPLAPTATSPAADSTATRVAQLVAAAERVLADEATANRILLRGFSTMPDLPPFDALYRLRAGAFAGYPLYRGVAAACGMEVVDCPKAFADIVPAVAARWADFDYFFIHVKQTDQAGEDGDLAAKARVLEAVDAALPDLLDLGPDVLCVTGDHSTPAPMAAHSWHPVPTLLWGRNVFVDDCERYDELAAGSGHLGTFPASRLLALLLAHAGRLAKFGA